MGLSKLNERNIEANIELNLAPMLSLMVSLIPCLLLSAAFVHLVVIDSPIPQIVAEAITKEQKETEHKTNIMLWVTLEKGFEIEIVEGNKSKKVLVTNLAGGALDFDRLHSELIKVKQVYPEVFRVEIHPTDKVTYKDLVKLMDRARTTEKGDPALHLKDGKTGATVEHNQLFPNAVFGNVAGA